MEKLRFTCWLAWSFDLNRLSDQWHVHSRQLVLVNLVLLSKLCSMASVNEAYTFVDACNCITYFVRSSTPRSSQRNAFKFSHSAFVINWIFKRNFSIQRKAFSFILSSLLTETVENIFSSFVLTTIGKLTDLVEGLLKSYLKQNKRENFWGKI